MKDYEQYSSTKLHAYWACWRIIHRYYFRITFCFSSCSPAAIDELWEQKDSFPEPFVSSAWLIKPMESWVLSVIAGAAFASFINSYDEEQRSHSE